MNIIDIVFESQPFFNHLDFMEDRLTMKLLFSDCHNLFVLLRVFVNVFLQTFTDLQ